MIPVIQQDVEDRLRRTLTAGEVTYLDGVNTEASALVEGYLGFEYDPDDAEVEIPLPVVVTVSRVMARMYERSTASPAGVDSLSRGMGPLSATTHYVADATSGGAYLTNADKTTLDPYRGSGGVQCVPLVRRG